MSVEYAPPIGHSDRHADERSYLRGCVIGLARQIGKVEYGLYVDPKNRGAHTARRRQAHKELLMRRCDARLTYLLSLSNDDSPTSL